MHCGITYSQPLVVQCTSSTMCIIGANFGLAGLICCFCCKEPVPSCPDCRRPLNGQTYYC